LNSIYNAFQSEGLDIYYVMLENASGATATATYAEFWQGMFDVSCNVIVDQTGYMWRFLGKVPGIGVVLDRTTMEIVFVDDGGDMTVYSFLHSIYVKGESW
jgi:hypothetical protein